MSQDAFPKFDTMNEVDVREEIVRPFLARLGYRHGADAYVQTEVPLTYSNAFLGRKNPKKDPVLRGRADYVCGVIAMGRWVIEVKSPSERIDEDAVQQAHTYAAHPEVAAYYFMLTNGREFFVYETGRLSGALLKWSFADGEDYFLRASNVLSPEAIRRRARLVPVDAGEPLGHGLQSNLEILRGSVVYASSHGSSLTQLMSSLAGLKLPVSGGGVTRDPDGRIHATVSVAAVAPLMKTFGAVGLADQYEFYSSDRFISTDEDHPTIFQNNLHTRIGQGTSTNLVGLVGSMPFSIETSAFTEVIGFVRDDEFQGTMRIEADVTFGPMDPIIAAYIQSNFGLVSGVHHVSQTGTFQALLAPARQGRS